MTPTPFQLNCLESVTSLLRSERLAPEVQLVRGEGEDYYVVMLKELPIKIYLYDDEAGFFRDDDWLVFESPDYASSEELKLALLNRLQAAISALRRPRR
jgi:hypothetical protein